MLGAHKPPPLCFSAPDDYLLLANEPREIRLLEILLQVCKTTRKLYLGTPTAFCFTFPSFHISPDTLASTLTALQYLKKSFALISHVWTCS
jgi:hypothetical protein